MSINFVFDDSELDSEFSLGQKRVLRRLLEKLAAAVPSSLDDLVDVNAPAPDVDDNLRFDGDEWVPLAGGGAVLDVSSGNPVIVVEANASQEGTFSADGWKVIRTGNFVTVHFTNLQVAIISANTQTQVSFPLPTFESMTPILASLTGTAVSEDTGRAPIAAVIKKEVGATSLTDVASLQFFWPTGYSNIANFYGSFCFEIEETA